MGVNAIKIELPFEAGLKRIERADPPRGRLSGNGEAYFIDHAVVDSYRAVNRLLKEGAEVGWARDTVALNDKVYPPGAVVVTGQDLEKTISALAEEFHLEIRRGSPPDVLTRLHPLKLGLYKPWVANMDEGWIRWIFDTWEFPYHTLHDQEIRDGDLRKKFDAILIANISAGRIMNGHREGRVPPEYAGGIGEPGLAALQAFVKAGGTLITLNSGCQLPIEHFEIPVANTAGSLPTTEFFCPSAILKVEVDNTHPIGYGMAETADILSYGSPFFEMRENKAAGSAGMPLTVKAIARYPGSSPLMSGRLIGENHLFHKPALLEIAYGQGRIIMFGFRPQNRAQTHGTFLMFFNSLYHASINNPADKDK
jgi:hypothetical protein